MPIKAHASTYETFLTKCGTFRCYSGQVAQSKDFNYFVGLVIKGEYKKKEMTLESLAETSGIAYSTLRKKIAGASPILVSELSTLTRLIGVTPHQVLLEAESMLDQHLATTSRVSAVGSTTNDIDTKRKQNEARAMTTEQIEKTKHAATRDPEMDNDEPN